jgi:hypothetical protein
MQKTAKGDPLEGHPKYEKVSCMDLIVLTPGRVLFHLTFHYVFVVVGLSIDPFFYVKKLQVRDLNSGTFGVVQLALDKETGRQVAIKSIDRGDKVSRLWGICRGVFPACQHFPCSRLGSCMHFYHLSTLVANRFNVLAGQQICGERDNKPSTAGSRSYRSILRSLPHAALFVYCHGIHARWGPV